MFNNPLECMFVHGAPSPANDTLHNFGSIKNSEHDDSDWIIVSSFCVWCHQAKYCSRQYICM